MTRRSDEWRKLLVLLGVVSLLVSSPLGTSQAAAQAAGDDAASMDDEARLLFEAGRTAFAAGRFADALQHFTRSYELSHRPQLLYNIGQCQDRLRHDAEALAAFEQFLELVPGSDHELEVRSRLEILRGAVEDTVADDTVADDTVADDTVADDTVDDDTVADDTVADDTVDEGRPIVEVRPSDEGPGAAPLVLAISGGVVAATGIALLVAAALDIAAVENAEQDSSWALVRDAAERAPILSGVGYAALGVGLALVGVGVGWAVSSSSDGAPSASLHLGPGNIRLLVQF